MPSQGHEGILFGVLDAESTIRAAGINFSPFAEKECPSGSIPEIFKPIAERHGLAVMEYFTQRITPDLTRATLEHLAENLRRGNSPDRLQSFGIDSALLSRQRPTFHLAVKSLALIGNASGRVLVAKPCYPSVAPRHFR